jgi:hypothetical protein
MKLVLGARDARNDGGNARFIAVPGTSLLGSAKN